MAGVVQHPEVPIVLACQDNVFVAVPQSLLIKESTVFQAELSNTWLQNKEVLPPVKKRKRMSKTAVNGNSTEETKEEEKSEHSETNISQPRVIQIKEFKSEAVKVVIEWIKGYTVLLSTCKDIQILADMIMFADYYDIQRPMKSLVVQFECIQIHFDDLISTMGVVEKLERLASAKDISMKLESRCKELAISQLKSANILSKFVRDNCDNMAYVLRLLKNCDGLLYEPQPLKQVIEPRHMPMKASCNCLFCL